MTHPWFAGATTPRILAHRGFVPPDADEIAENTLAAFAAAQGLGIDYIETDAHVTSDGHAVLAHDADLARVAVDPRALSDVTLREFQDVMATRGGGLTVKEALEAFPDVRFNVDVKTDSGVLPVAAAVATDADRVLLTSFSDGRRQRTVAAAQARGGRPAASAGTSQIARAVGASRLRSDRLFRRAVTGVDALQVPERHKGVQVVTRHFVRAAHRAGVEVHVWTVNDPDDMSRLLDLGVDGLVTDYADVALAVRAARETKG